LAGRVHGGDHRLVRCLAVRTDGQRQAAIPFGFPLQRCHQTVQVVFHQRLAIHRKAAVGANHHFQGLEFGRWRWCTADRLRQVNLQLRLAGEGRSDHKKQQQDEYHVDQRRQADLDVILSFAPELHAFLTSRLLEAGVSARSTLRSPCTTSTSLLASCSMPITSSSTRRCRKRWKNSAGIATIRPAAVVIKALAIPPASCGALAMPEPMNELKISIMPSTVPSKPSKGAIPAIVPRALR